MDTIEMLTSAVDKKAADIFLVAGQPLSFKLDGRIQRQSDDRLTTGIIEEHIQEMYKMANRDISTVRQSGDDDFSFSIVGVSRFRVNVYKQRGSLATVIRVVTFKLPDPTKLGLPQIVMELSENTKGLILVTGPAGSGKSTTLACVIDKINKTRNSHIITLEDPIEYLHSHCESIVSQRELDTDTISYVAALRAALRQAPDVVLLGEMRDFETIATAVTAAETGHLVMSTLHTIGAATTIDRIIDAFPPSQQNQIRVQLSMVLVAVVSQQLIPSIDGKSVPAFEIMIVNNAIRNMIREAKIHQINSVLESSASEGMVTMDNSILELYNQGKIDRRHALLHSANSAYLDKKLEFRF